MAEIIQIKGNVKYPIYIDTGVWIFDERKFNIEAVSYTHLTLPTMAVV